MTDVWAVHHFIRRQIQPLKDRVHLALDYMGETDPTHESPEMIKSVDLTARVRRLCAPRIDIPTQAEDFPRPFNASFQPPVDNHQFPSHSPRRAVPEQKRAAVASSDEPASQRLASDPDAEFEVLEVLKEGDAPIAAKPTPSSRSFKPTKQFFFRQGTR
ncbi:uncharacterized protein LOC121054180 [Oryza brachyantha]|nr:uncharacterized protein LOC121054180 [Oryza brachyantha]